jgi:hypothetical protein
MDRASLLIKIADTAYNVGFGAKKHFATYDIVEKAPGWIGFVSLTVGVFALVLDMLATKYISAILIVLGISGLLVNAYNDTKQKYEETGKRLTTLFNNLKGLYLSVKASNKTDLSEEINELNQIEEEFCANCISKQIFFSDWYAHYKFFWQHQIEWIDEQKHFKFWRDKVPLSLTIVIAASLVLIAILVSYYSYSMVSS